MAQEKFLDPPLDDVIAQWHFYLRTLDPQPGDVILDVGCSSGDAARLLLSEYPAITVVVGVDVKPNPIAEAQTKWQADGRPAQLEYRQADARQLPFPDHHFDRVICAEMLEWVEPPAAALQEIQRVLKPNGTALVIHTDYDTQVFPTTDKALTRRVTSAFTDTGPNGQIGRELYGMCVQLGFRKVLGTIYPLVNTEWRPDRYAYRVAHMMLDWLRPSGAFAPDELDRWLADLQAHGAANTFFYSVNRYLCSWTK